MDLAFVIILGGLWGSFANVCIYRLPKEKSVVSGRSYCPKCNKKIVWYDNIPIISFFMLGAKCRRCKKSIPFQYVIVETVNIISFAKHFIIPNEITFTMMIIGFLKSFDPNLHFLFPNYLDSLIGGLFGYGVIWSIIFFYKQIRKKEGMGLGDAKLLSAIGFWFGWISIPFVLFFSSVFALIWVTPDLIKKSKKLATQIPFGPYLILASILFFVSKEKLIDLLVI